VQAADNLGDSLLERDGSPAATASLSTAEAEACWLRCQTLRPKLAASLRAMLPDHHAVDDCLQDTFILMTQRYADAGKDDLSPLAFTCARHKAHAWLAKNRTGKLSIVEPELLGKIAEAAARIEAQDPVEYPARIFALRDCLNQLSPEQRALVEARYGSDRNASVVALADGKGRKVDSLYKQLERLREILKRCVSGKLASQG
jgi:RNA polymerase sigma factor (sigma-70 family)